MDLRQPLFRLFFVFSNKQHNFYIKSMWKMSKCPSCIQHRDSNPRSFEHESSPITTRPGLPPFQEMLMNKFNNNFGFNKSSLDIFFAFADCFQGSSNHRTDHTHDGCSKSKKSHLIQSTFIFRLQLIWKIRCLLNKKHV